MHPTPPSHMARDLGKTPAAGLKPLPEPLGPPVPCRQPSGGQSLDSCVRTPNGQPFCDKEQLQSPLRPPWRCPPCPLAAAAPLASGASALRVVMRFFSLV